MLNQFFIFLYLNEQKIDKSGIMRFNSFFNYSVWEGHNSFLNFKYILTHEAISYNNINSVCNRNIEKTLSIEIWISIKFQSRLCFIYQVISPISLACWPLTSWVPDIRHRIRYINITSLLNNEYIKSLIINFDFEN